ncbi:phage head-tail joining protein [Sulfitobacter sp. 1A12779]|uniref:phage head-tail joining protein n=1 Tax=Sulfitobacter sp. 1A12779 TaxID=3368599 RepID=UPI003745423E
MTLEELTACRDRLRRARFKGIMTVRMDGEEVTYKTDAQMAAALASIEAEISKLTRGPRPRTIYPQTTKGLT